MENTVNSQPAKRSAGIGNLSWVLQAATGTGLVLLAGLHMFANHFAVEGGLQNFHDAQVYLQDPIILPLETLFLVLVTSHALLGVRAIMFDFGFSPQTEKRITQFLWGVGLVTVAYGLWLFWAVINYK